MRKALLILVGTTPFVLAAVLAEGSAGGLSSDAGVALAETPPQPAEPPPPPEPTFDTATVTPLFPPGPFADAAKAIDEGKGAEALRKLPPEGGTPAVRFLRGRALALVGRHSDAAKELAEVAPSLGLLEPRASCDAARSLLTLRRYEEALAQLEACAKDPVLAGKALIERSKALEGLGRTEEALEAVRPLVEERSRWRAAALARAAALRETLGMKPVALETWRRLYIEEPVSSEATEARRRAAALVRELGAPQVSPERLVERAERLMRLRQLRLARAELKQVKTPSVCPKGTCFERCLPADAKRPEAERPKVDPKPFTLADVVPARVEPDRTLPSCAVVEIEEPADPLACRVELLHGWIAQRTRASTKALGHLRPVYARCADPEVRALALFLAAEAAARVRDPDADELARILSRQFPESSFGDDVLLKASERARDRGDLKTERALLEEIVRYHPDGDQRGEALFRIFWSHRAEGHPVRGLYALEILDRDYDGDRTGDGGDAERGRYWWGRTVAELAAPEERAKGIEKLETLARERPLTYYGLLARSWLVAHGEEERGAPITGPAHEGPLRLSALADTGVVEVIAELLKYGFHSEAREALLAIDRTPLRADGRRGQEASLIVAELLAKAGDARMSHHVARADLLGLVRDASDPLARRGARVAYPLAFRDPIVEWCKAHGFDPNLMQGLMREESALDPRARSPVGARGLTQVMPATGRQVAQWLGIRNFKVDQLWDPATNIRIGSKYLSQMLNRFGHPGLAAAAYNAGPGNLNRWLDRGMPEQFDAFVEEIPFDETRGYVKRVLRSYASYRYLYDDAGPSLAVDTVLAAAKR